MSISQEAIQKILGIEEDVKLEPKEMAPDLKITFFPHDQENINENIKSFSEELKKTLLELGVNIIPYEEALGKVPLHKVLKRGILILLNNTIAAMNLGREPIPFKIFLYLRRRKKVRKGISVIALGDSKTGNLPVDYTMSFRDTSVITIVDMPEGIEGSSDFHKHFDTAMELFAHHMTNIVIAVNEEKWLLYNFNASHPVYSRDHNFKKDILEAFVPKVAAPIRPHRFLDFIVKKDAFSTGDSPYKEATEDMISSGGLLEKTGLYPKGKLVGQLPFRNEVYQWIGKIHLDHRSGMSYGFLARQLPVEPSHLTPLKDNYEKDYFISENAIYIIVNLDGEKFHLKVPDVFVLTQRSGSDKTHINPDKDLIVLGLVNGRMVLETPIGLKIKSDYKPSFDTKIILAHAVGNAIIASMLNHISPTNKFSKIMKEDGMALAHWHGYIKKEFVPRGWHVYGVHNPHVACSTAQSAIYALYGKIQAFMDQLPSNEEYMGDIHIEPQHGTNITFSSLEELGKYLSQKDIVKLGNAYLESNKHASNSP